MSNIDRIMNKCKSSQIDFMFIWNMRKDIDIDKEFVLESVINVEGDSNYFVINDDKIVISNTGCKIHGYYELIPFPFDRCID